MYVYKAKKYIRVHTESPVWTAKPHTQEVPRVGQVS
jgi:hypothetical protein